MIRKPPTRLRDPLDELGKIDKSLRLRSAASAYLSRTPSVAGSQTAWTISGWFKRGVVATSTIFGCAPNNQNYMSLGFGFVLSGTEKMEFIGSYGNVIQFRLQTTQVFRDPSAWYHVVAVYDSANATASDRVRLYINGVRVTAFDATAYPAQNYAFPYINTTSYAMYLSSSMPYYTSQYFFDGMLAGVAFTDGLALDASYFGKFHPRTGQWRPKSRTAIKAVVDAGGANSFFLPFDDATSLATLTGDASAKGNNWTATNISLTPGPTYDSMLDTPTNNFAVMSPLQGVYGTLSDGNLYSLTSDTVMGGPNATIGVSSGKWYWEITSGSANSVAFFGIRNQNAPVSEYPGQNANSYAYYQSGQKYANAVASAYGASWAQPDVVGVAFDADAGTITFYKNGVSQGVAFSEISMAGNSWFPAHGDGSTAGAGAGRSGDWFNFGQRPFSYTPPAGFKPLCTKNLPAIYPVMNSTKAFVAKTNSGANIVADLSAASPWSDWIRIYKRRDAVEAPRWQFSDDPSNFLDSSSSAAKAAFPALGGTSYGGYAMKVSAANGIVTGRLNHTNGASSVVADGLATANKIVMLRNEAGGDWLYYHPGLTAGCLLKLNSASAEAVDSSISAVNSLGFTVSSALASGTYRWIVFADVDGFLDIQSWTQSASLDGPFVYSDTSPDFVHTKNKGTVDHHMFTDRTREPFNAMDSILHLGIPNAEAVITSYQHDYVANGIKLRANGPGWNGAAGNINVGFSFGRPFRYANAR